MSTGSLRPPSFVLAGKLILLLLVTVVAGRTYHQGLLADNEKFHTITLEEYTADFETYRAHLQGDGWPLWANIVLVGIFVVGLFGLYELLGHASGWLLATMMPIRTGSDERPRTDGEPPPN